MLAEKSLKEFFEEVASIKPTPGGGSVAALSGALGSTLLAMVSRLTIGRKEYEDVASEFENILKNLEDITKKFAELISEDAKAFDKVIEAYKAGNKEVVESALKRATQIPLEIMRVSLTTLNFGKTVAEKGNIPATSDTGCACHCLENALKCAELNVKINLSSVADRNFIAETRKEIEKLIAESELLRAEIMATVDKRI